MCGILGRFARQGPLATRVRSARPRICSPIVDPTTERGGATTASSSSRPLRSSIFQPAANPWRAPMADLIVFNGEIYNFIEVRQRLVAEGVAFSTHSDTEVILRGYEHWGTSVARELVGMFAFAIVVRVALTLYLARDRFGEKPLFVHVANGMVSFASSCTRSPHCPACSATWTRPRSENTSASTTCRKSARSSTVWGVCDRAPGACTRGRPRRKKPIGHRRRRRRAGVGHGSCEGVIPAADACRRCTPHRVAKRRAGHALSLGRNRLLDHRRECGAPWQARARLLSRLRGKRIQRVAERAKSRQRSRIELRRAVLSAAALDDFLAIVEHADDPLADSSAVAVWALSREVARDYKVAISGDGGDELFGGYLTYKATRYHQALTNALPSAALDALARLGSRIPVSTGKVTSSYRLRRFLRAANFSSGEAHFTWNGSWLPAEAAALRRIRRSPRSPRPRSRVSRAVITSTDRRHSRNCSAPTRRITLRTTS